MGRASMRALFAASSFASDTQRRTCRRSSLGTEKAIPANDSAPVVSVRRVAGAALEKGLRGFAVALVDRGEIVLRSASERGEWIRVNEGDLVCLPDGVTCEIPRIAAGTSTIVVHAPWSWVQLAFSAGQARGLPSGAPHPLLLRARSEAARRSTCALRALLLLPELSAGAATLRHMAVALELAATAFDAATREHAPATTRRPGAARRAAFLEALESVRREPLEAPSLSSLASRLGVGPRQVSRLFRDELGTSFRSYLTQVRLDRARRLLAESDRSVLDVALESGWGSLASFYEAFRRHVGVPPSSYRAANAPRGTNVSTEPVEA